MPLGGSFTGVTLTEKKLVARSPTLFVVRNVRTARPSRLGSGLTTNSNAPETPDREPPPKKVMPLVGSRPGFEDATTRMRVVPAFSRWVKLPKAFVVVSSTNVVADGSVTSSGGGAGNSSD